MDQDFALSQEESAPDPPPQTVERHGLTWCLSHQLPLEICHCRVQTPTHNWGKHNALRRYLSVVSTGQTHPFKRAGGQFVDFAEGAKAVQQALARATVESVPLKSLVATDPVTSQHIERLLRGTPITPRTGSAFELADMPTVVRIQDGAHHLIKDGHHRCTAAWCRGESHAKMRVLSGLTPRFQNHSGLLLEPQ